MQAAYREYLEETPVLPPFSGEGIGHADVGPPEPIGVEPCPGRNGSLLKIQTKPLRWARDRRRTRTDPTERISP